MPADRFFTEELLKVGSDLCLEEQEFHHLVHVSRVAEKEVIELVNGQGQLAHAEVVAIHKRHVRLTPIDLVTESEPHCKITLVQAVVRMQRLDLIVEKGTELGVDRLLLFPAYKSERKGQIENLPRQLRNTAISALKQCGRLHLPSIESAPSLDSWQNFPSGPAFFGDIAPEAPHLLHACSGSFQSSAIYLFVGPESGFSDGEIAFLRSHQVQGVSLSKNILRTETAAITGLALLTALRTQGP